MKLPFLKSVEKKWSFLLLACMLLPSLAITQFKIGGQMIQRAEYRHGYGKLISAGTEPAAFISQRLRLQGTYQWDKISLYASIQDIRTWGTVSQAKLTDHLLSVHEAWLLIPINEFWSIQLGRQELNYDNVRFLGNLDWVLQARAHDFVKVMYEKKHLKFHIGGGYNQGGESLSGNTLTIADQYKEAQLARIENKHGDLEYSILFWNNGRQFIQRDSLNQISEKHTCFTQTFGISNLTYQKQNAKVSGFAYYQIGKDLFNRKVNAYDAGLQIYYQFKINETNTSFLKTIVGYEILSGTHQKNTLKENHSFDPMYGTNHIHNGYMDYFYVGGRHTNSVGLRDGFARLSFHPATQIFVNLSYHTFWADADIHNESVEMKKSLGSEIDFTAGYTFNKALSLQVGYSQIFAKSSLKFLQGIHNSAPTQNWVYLMLIFRPDSNKKYIGVIL